MILNDEYFMKEALKLAQRAFDEDEVPIGAVVVYNGQIIGKGYNQSVRLTDATAHAEILALSAAYQFVGSSVLDECHLYVSVEPCVMCAGALKWSRIGNLVYGADEPKSGFSLYTPSLLHKSTKVKRGILATEASQMMSEFFRLKRESK